MLLEIQVELIKNYELFLQPNFLLRFFSAAQIDRLNDLI